MPRILVGSHQSGDDHLAVEPDRHHHRLRHPEIRVRPGERRGAWRIVDETYLDLADREPDGSDVKSVLACDPDAIVCSSFSKFFGMTGWRLGWMVVPECALEAMDDLATNFFLCAHTPTQHAALACFTPETLAVCEERRQELLERRRIVVDGLAEIGLPLEVEPNGAFYAYFNISSTGLARGRSASVR